VKKLTPETVPFFTKKTNKNNGMHNIFDDMSQTNREHDHSNTNSAGPVKRPQYGLYPPKIQMP